MIEPFGSLPFSAPSSAAELGELVRRAAADGQAVYPVGGRTALDYGLPPTKPGLVADLRGLNRVIEHVARDMTITAQAGITVATLQEALAGEGQRLPIDAPDAGRATLGGLLATNTSGPRRLGYGTLRDYVLGLSFVNDEGQEAKSGGRVVKNVAGYDLHKLMIGALGTLGVITQATLKVLPAPEEGALVTLACDGDEVGPLLDRLHGSRTRPVCVELLNRRAARAVAAAAHEAEPGSTWLVAAGFEGNRDAVHWQVQQLTREAGGKGRLVARVGSAAGPLWRALVETLPGWDALLTFKATLLPRAVAAFCRAADGLGDVLLQAHAHSGVVRGAVCATDAGRPEAATMLALLRGRASEAQGGVVVERCPAAWKDPAFVWGPPRGDVALMRAVKDQFDPRRLFNPGRFVGGL
jgi:glycolate oxidase FAD binding subunit